MLKIKLYIGAHKTATTHIQRLLDQNRSILSSHDIKISIPSDLRKEWLPSFYNFCLHNDTAMLPSIMSEAPKQGTWILAEENISGNSYHFKISSGIYPTLKIRLNCIKQIFKDIDIELFFSMRCYDSFYRSTYLEVVRNRGFIPFHEYYNENRFKNNSWVDVIDMFTSIIPEKNITLWCYEDFRELLPHILNSMTGLDNATELIAAYDVEKTRPSLSKKTIEILSSLYPTTSQEEPKQLVEKINNDYPVSGGNESYCPFNNEEIDKFQQQYKQDLSVIKNKYPNINFL